MPYVDLSRRFRDLTQAELEEPELLAFLNDRSWPPEASKGWADLLQYPRVLVIAEAGSGKTWEMREQARRLEREGKPAFFIPLESLDREPLTESMSSAQEHSLADWRIDNLSTAWFFLDAVDELKLSSGSLDRALGRFAKAIDGLLHRAHVVISSRPSDWRPEVDMATVRERLPISSGVEIDRSDPDELFLAALQDERKSREKAPTKDGVRAVVLLPLSEGQIETLARDLGVNSPAVFMEELRRRDALVFARRPLDLVELVASWNANGRLGTHSQQHESNVAAKLKDDPDRSDRGRLTEERARSGAERLALALTLTRTRMIRSPEQAFLVERAEGVLDPEKILIDWTEDERKTLLRRALFDPATYGRVRFHHRSVQEYLAACRLKAMRRYGMPVKSLRRLLFAECYGEYVVIPSMRPIAAWLALWEDDVLREVIAREPETLLSMGDPESLPMAMRARLLRAFAGAYGRGGWRGLNIPVQEIRRLADPELTGVVRELWATQPANPEVRGLLLEAIWQGPIEGCADIAGEAAFDVEQSDIERVIAIRALLACGKVEIIYSVSDSILREPSKWPDSIVHAVAFDLFPCVFSVADLVSLIQRMRKPENSGGDFTWPVKQIAGTIDSLSDPAVELRDALADLVWLGRNQEQEWYRLKGSFDHVAPALALLCDRQLKAKAATVPDSRLIWACVVANRFGSHEAYLIKNLAKHFEVTSMLREAAFWSELKLISEAAEWAENARDRYRRAELYSLIEPITDADRPWLLEALRNSREPEHRLVALHALLVLWDRRGQEQPEFDELVKATQGNEDLVAVLSPWSQPLKPDPEEERLKREEKRLERESCQGKLEQENLKRQGLESWAQWKRELIANPEVAFSAENLPSTKRNLYVWLEKRQGSVIGFFNVWDADALREVFGDDVAARAAKAFQAVWRAHPPTLRSRRLVEDRNSISWLCCEGLTGLASEAVTPDWAKRLTSDEARVAAAYATIEINQFPDWLREVAIAHKAAVEEVIGSELIAELADEREYSQTLQRLTHTHQGLKRLLASRLQATLPNWSAKFGDPESCRRSEQHLSQILDVLSDVLEGQQRITVAAVCDRQFSEHSNEPLELVWLRGLFRFNPERAVQAFEERLARLPDHERSVRSVEMFANLFGGKSLVFNDDRQRAAVLGRLVRCAYSYVRPGEDQEHEGAYSPDARDRAERTRGFLLNYLLDTPGAEAWKVVRDLAEESVAVHHSDWLRLLARQRAASDAEGAPFKPEQVVALEKEFEAPPHDRDGLFTVMIDRLEDLAHDVAHHDFTDRHTMRTIQEEREMQRTLARRLEYVARGAYTVLREDEVADLKRTDIRLAATHCDQKAVIEVKIADKRWSLTELEQALRAQLVGQYLRHDTCRAGCLLLTYDGTKNYWEHPETGGRLSFPEVVEYLRHSAQTIEQEVGYQVRLSIVPLDLTDPPLEPARR